MTDTESIEFPIVGKIYMGPRMILGYFIFRFLSWGGFRIFSSLPYLYIEKLMLGAHPVVIYITIEKYKKVNCKKEV